MSDIIVVAATDITTDDAEVADTTRSTPGPDGGAVPGRCAGYVWDGAAYCPECAREVEAEAPDGDGTIPLSHYPAFETDPNGFGVGVIAGWDEWDYPGASCDVCLRRLDTNVLVYLDGGPSPHRHCWVSDPDGMGETARAWILDTDGDDVLVMLAESFRPWGRAGDTTWLPRDDVTDCLDE